LTAVFAAGFLAALVDLAAGFGGTAAGSFFFRTAFATVLTGGGAAALEALGSFTCLP
jgi:hypothetical protein